MIKKVLFFVLVFALTLRGFSKEYPSINLTQNDGLISNSIFDIYQDEKGFMWFASGDGISRFNGIKFENFTTNNGLADNLCYYFRKDYYGRLWIGSNNGMLQFYKDGVLYSEKNAPYLKLPFTGGIIIDMVVEKDSSITVTFQDRTKFISIYQDRIKVFDLSKNKKIISTSEIPILDITRTNSNSYNIIYPKEKWVLDSNLNIVSITKHPKNIVLHKLVVCREEDFYIDANNNFYTKNLSVYKKLPLSISSPFNVNRINLFKNHSCISYSGGVYFDSCLIFNNTFVTTVFQDKDENFWISTLQQGVYKLSKFFYNSYEINRGIKNYTIYKHIFNAKTIGNKLYTISIDRNFSIYTDGELSYNFDCEKNVNRKTSINSSGCFWDDNIFINSSAINPYIVSNLEQTTPNSKIHFSNKCFSTIYLIKNNSYIYSCDKRTIWYFPYDEYKKNYKSFLVNYYLYKNSKWKKVSTHDTFNNERIYSFEKNINNQIWLQTNKNIYKIINDSCVIVDYLSKFNTQKMLICNNYMVCISKINSLILINNYQNSNCKIDTTSIENCVISSIRKINDTSVLLITNDFYRIVILKPSSDKPNYKIQVVDNPIIPQFAFNLFSDSHDVYFFYKNRISKFPIEELFKTFSPPNIFFTKIKSLDREYEFSPSISLSYPESRELSIQYNVVSLNANKISFEYSISSGTDTSINKWLKADGESISLLKIGFGDYVVKIRAITASGVCSNIASFALIIQKPFWLSWWFLSLAALILFTLIVMTIRYFINKKNKEKEKEIKFIQSEYRALNALMNPHFIFNSINNVQGLINNDQKQSASEYLRTISDLIRQNMYNISGDFISMEKEFDLISNYLKLEKLRFNDLLNYEINIDPSIELDLIKIPPLLIQPLVENALKYGLWQSGVQNGYIKIDVYHDHKFICIDVIDNGKGFIPNKNNETEHQSTALNNVRKRMEQLSKMHNKIFQFSIEEIKNNEAEILGVKASIKMEE